MKSLKCVCSIFFLLCFSSIFSQETKFNGNDTLRSELDSLVTIPIKNVIYRDYSQPFLLWKQRPQSVCFELFNRWGQRIDMSYNPDFTVDVDNFKNNHHEGETFFYRIAIIKWSGEKITVTGKVTSVGYWRCG